MAACCFSSSSTPSANQSAYLADENNIAFPKRSSNYYSIFKDKATNEFKDNTTNEHRITLEDWSRQHESSERNLNRKEENSRSAFADLYQILGLFFVFQGVILTAVAQSNLLTCHNWRLPFFLCLLTSIFAFGASLQKLMEVAECKGQVRIERAHYISLHKSIEKLKQQGTKFDIVEGQPELSGPYTDEELKGKGSFAQLHSSIWRFCRTWIISYAGAVLLLLFVFSGVTLFSVPQILCNPGKQKPTT